MMMKSKERVDCRVQRGESGMRLKGGVNCRKEESFVQLTIKGKGIVKKYVGSSTEGFRVKRNIEVRAPKIFP